MSKAFATSGWSWEKEKTTEGELHEGGFKYPPGVDPQVAGLFWVRYGEGSPRELLLSMLSAGSGMRSLSWRSQTHSMMG